MRLPAIVGVAETREQAYDFTATGRVFLRPLLHIDPRSPAPPVPTRKPNAAASGPGQQAAAQASATRPNSPSLARRMDAIVDKLL